MHAMRKTATAPIGRVGSTSETQLALTYPEHLSPARWTHTLGRRFSVLHSDGLGILHYLLRLAFHTVCLHVFTSFLLRTIDHSLSHVNGSEPPYEASVIY